MVAPLVGNPHIRTERECVGHPAPGKKTRMSGAPGEIQHKNLRLVDLETGTEKQLTNIPSNFDIGDFDISPDGREVVLEREQERSDVVLMDLPQQ